MSIETGNENKQTDEDRAIINKFFPLINTKTVCNTEKSNLARSNQTSIEMDTNSTDQENDAKAVHWSTVTRQSPTTALVETRSE